MNKLLIVLLLNAIFQIKGHTKSLFSCNSKIKIRNDQYTISFKILDKKNTNLSLRKNGTEIQDCNFRLKKEEQVEGTRQSIYTYRFWENIKCKKYLEDELIIERSGYIKISHEPKRPSYLVINRNSDTLECLNSSGYKENLDEI